MTPNEIEDFYGTDLRLVPQLTNGVLSFDLAMKGAGDVQLISGPPNLEQALTLRLLTTKGDNTTFPDLGLPDLLGDPSSAETLGHFAAHVRTQMLSDPRIARLRELIITDTGDGLEANARLETAEGSIKTVTIPATR